MAIQVENSAFRKENIPSRCETQRLISERTYCIPSRRKRCFARGRDRREPWNRSQPTLLARPFKNGPASHPQQRSSVTSPQQIINTSEDFLPDYLCYCQE